MDTLENQIDNAIRDTRRNYDDAIETVQRLKTKLNALERKLVQSLSDKQVQRTKNLESVIDSISQCSDMLIVRSRKTWNTYKRFLSKCRIRGLTTTKLDELKALCKKTEAIAADMLCYSLGQQKDDKPFDKPS